MLSGAVCRQSSSPSTSGRCTSRWSPPVRRCGRRCRRTPRLARVQPVSAALNSDSLKQLSTANVLEELSDAPVLGDGGASRPSQTCLEFVESIPRDHQLLSGCEVERAPLRVAVLLSGGVDSSVALALLRAAGHECQAFYLQIWFQEDFRNFWDACPWEEDLEYAKKVCAALDVPMETVPLTEQYWQLVVAHCVTEIKRGRTPNPDMLCNSRVKFGAFFRYLQQHHGSAFDRIASGHYAALQRGDGAAVRLALTPDSVKDQTYFLAHLSQEQLARTTFPLGSLTKQKVREVASRAGLPTQDRRDSQGICFLGKVKFGEFVREHLGEWPGPIIEAETHRVLGIHAGFWFFTVGQRQGICLPGGPWYVLRKDAKRNAVFVSRQYFSDDKRRNGFLCGSFSWIAGAPPRAADGQLLVKVRHGPQMYRCRRFELRQGGLEALVEINGQDQGLAAGQFAVFYQAGVCLGSAVMTASLEL